METDAILREVAVAEAERGLFGSSSPATIGRFELTRRVGAGGLGVVYAAWDPELEREVAVKLVRARARADREAGRGLRAEARAMAQVRHPNIVTIYEVGQEVGQEPGDAGGVETVFLVMELVEGSTLRGTFGREESWRVRVDRCLDAARGLAHAHAHGLVHRDFKPDNVLVDTHGRVQVTDFGLARASELDDDDAASPTATRELDGVIGTPAYMAPEQHRGEVAGPASDQYALCVTLYEAIAGRRPFAGSSPAELAEQKQRVPRGDGDRAPSWVWAAIARGLDPDPTQRWPDLDALSEALSTAPRRPLRRVLWIAVLTVLTAFVLVGAVLQGVVFWDWIERASAEPGGALRE